MTKKEIFKYEVIKELIDGKINATDASKKLGITTRHIRRLKPRVLKHGIKGIIHKSRGRESNRKLSNEKLENIKNLLKEKYSDFGPLFATEKLNEKHDTKVGKETIRQTMIEMKLWKPKPRKDSKNKKHFWRPRKDNFGEMQQFDGSYHVWFGDFESCLLLSVDDATGKITHAKFDLNESVVAVFKFWLEYFELNGFPISIYLDKFSTYKVNHKNATDNKELITQFGRAMRQVNVKIITANTPQAKGRVERMNQTLQDRLVKELKLAGITSIDKANEFLKKYIPEFNNKFSVVPNRRKNIHRKVNKDIKSKLGNIFSIQDSRIINNDYTIMYKNQFIQLTEEQPTTVYKKERIIVEEHLNSEIKISHKGKYLNFTILPERPRKNIDIKLPALTRKKSTYKPPINHPWRKQFRANVLQKQYNNSN